MLSLSYGKKNLFYKGLILGAHIDRVDMKGCIQSPKNKFWIHTIVVVLFYPPVLRIRIRTFLGLLDPDPLIRGTDLDPDPSIIEQN
jgi:hypothetical protein